MVSMLTRFAVSPDVRSSSDEDGSTILHIGQDKIYSAIGIGSVIWARLVASRDGLATSNIVEHLHSQFDEVPRQQIEKDVELLLTSFQQKRLIQVVNEEGRPAEYTRDSVSSALLFLGPFMAAISLTIKLRAVSAFLGLATIDFLLKLVSFRALYNLVKSWPVSDKCADLEVVQQITDGVTRAITWYPRQAMCLQRSALMTCLLRSSGVHAQMIIGCQKFPFLTHAWVEVDGEVINDERRVQEIHKVLDRC